ncbi:glycosyltransferase [Providencia rettgeri]|uniref:Glycosyltransferase n=1 Tax=Providencia rettgeri TaxID=587 RepID=A0AAP2JW62_PRORE|nr:glycosyltransferase [Providencia rettgeri]MBX6958035.1 glycosyltransferase [Providencia rettgeri]MBX6960046.1 glycosyltransferase [Providencia rettgeri]MBX6974089.1 glycosyltransferase [Providencia rettgeri]MBX6979782.1 glycosyltransferase [Providencia rettgeri]MBX6986978.1 glycosyltransferase [Providencia rettgeri]
MKKQQLAPIALFIFKRLEHTRKTLEALKKNTLAKDSDLIIFSDGPRNPDEEKDIILIRKYIKSITGFKSIKIIEQKSNLGLAKSIISGVSKVCHQYGSVIVLEDDLETSETFLKFMNDALIFHKNNDDIISISGFSYPIKFPEKYKEDTYLLRMPLCWGWATWKEKWILFDKNLSTIDNITPNKISYINFNNTHDFFSQAIANKNGTLNTWFIFWYISAVLNNKKTIFPKYTLIQNIGHDGSGENCGNEDIFSSPKIENVNISLSNLEPYENDLIVKSYEDFFRKIKTKLHVRIFNKFKKVIYGLSK